MWAAYEALHRSAAQRQAEQQRETASNAGASDGSSPGPSSLSAEDEAAFVRLLQAGSQGKDAGASIITTIDVLLSPVCTAYIA